MAKEVMIRSVAEFIEIIKTPPFLAGLAGAPVMPWYIGQPDTAAKLLPSLYKSGIDPKFERELLRDFRMLSAEFSSYKGFADVDVMLGAHVNTMPSRIIEWMGNPLAALFLAVETLALDKHGKVWILNPWVLNALSARLDYVPMTDAALYMDRYVVSLNNPDLPKLPEALTPMAFRPYRISRNYNLHSTYYTVHGSGLTPIEDLKFFTKKASDFLTYVLIEGERKAVIMKDLHNLNITRATLFPAMPSLVRTICYRYSDAFLKLP